MAQIGVKRTSRSLKIGFYPPLVSPWISNFQRTSTNLNKMDSQNIFNFYSILLVNIIITNIKNGMWKY